MCEVTNLNGTIIRLTSVTYAMRAQRLLEQRGIRAYVKKLPRGLSAHGCGYGVSVVGDVDEAARLIAQAGIRVVAIE